MNAVFCLSLSDISTCQYPLAKSKVENHLDPDKVSNVSSILGKGYESLIVLALIFQQSTQNLVDPSFFLTKTMGEAQGLEEGSMTPRLSILSISSLTTCR